MKGTLEKGIFKKHNHRQVEVYTDVDWARSMMDKSTSDYCSFIASNLVTCHSKKQNVVARSSAEAVFRALAHGICEGIWIKRLLDELKVSQKAPVRV